MERQLVLQSALAEAADGRRRPSADVAENSVDPSSITAGVVFGGTSAL
jgi:hypothetical protein